MGSKNAAAIMRYFPLFRQSQRRLAGAFRIELHIVTPCPTIRTEKENGAAFRMAIPV
jgi:hypothetical protein